MESLSLFQPRLSFRRLLGLLQPLLVVAIIGQLIRHDNAPTIGAILINFCRSASKVLPCWSAVFARCTAGESVAVSRASCASRTASWTFSLKVACSSWAFFLYAYGLSRRTPSSPPPPEPPSGQIGRRPVSGPA